MMIARTVKATIGVVSCSKCGSDQVLTISEPNRTGFPSQPGHDDDMRVYCQCAACGFTTNASISGLRELTGTIMTVEQAEQQARRYWQQQRTHEDEIRRIFRAYPTATWTEYETRRNGAQHDDR